MKNRKLTFAYLQGKIFNIPTSDNFANWRYIRNQERLERESRIIWDTSDIYLNYHPHLSVVLQHQQLRINLLHKDAVVRYYRALHRGHERKAKKYSGQIAKYCRLGPERGETILRHARQVAKNLKGFKS